MSQGGTHSSVTVLVVDDDESTLHLISSFLRRNKYRVLSASNPVRALELLSAEPVSLVITDLMMPHADGLAFTQQIHELPQYKELPVILMTAFGTEELADQGMREGVALTLRKPVELNRLLALVEFATAVPPRG